MNVYNNAINNQKDNGQPIFFVNLVFYQLVKRGVKIKKVFEKANKVVVSGTIEQIKKEPLNMYNCLKAAYGREYAHKADKTKFGIEEIEFISFHGYSNVH